MYLEQRKEDSRTRRWRRTAAPLLRSERVAGSSVPFTLKLALPAAAAQLCVSCCHCAGVQMRHFETDRRLWKFVAFVVFILLWFTPTLPTPDARVCVCPALLWVALFKAPFYHDLSWNSFFEQSPSMLLFITGYALLFAIVALVAGWVFQAIVVILRSMRSDRHDHAA
jgi:hypothetical protein